MNKKELVENVFNSVKNTEKEFTKKQAAFVVDAFIEAITTTMEKGKEVAIVDFGRFTVKQRAERKGRNPQTGEDMLIQSANKVVFKPGKGIKDAVN
nr:HU family DNA-binding protein [uncultured Pseudomonas sp.]